MLPPPCTCLPADPPLTSTCNFSAMAEYSNSVSWGMHNMYAWVCMASTGRSTEPEWSAGNDGNPKPPDIPRSKWIQHTYMLLLAPNVVEIGSPKHALLIPSAPAHSHSQSPKHGSKHSHPVCSNQRCNLDFKGGNADERGREGVTQILPWSLGFVFWACASFLQFPAVVGFGSLRDATSRWPWQLR